MSIEERIVNEARKPVWEPLRADTAFKRAAVGALKRLGGQIVQPHEAGMIGSLGICKHHDWRTDRPHDVIHISEEVCSRGELYVNTQAD